MARRIVKFRIAAADKTRAAFMSVKRNLLNLQKLTGKITRGFGGIGSAIAAAFGGAAIKKIIDSGDKIQKLNQQLGISTEVLSEYRFVAELTGTSFEAISKGFAKLGKNASDAAKGLSTPKRALEDLNINIDDFLKLPIDEQFEVVTDRLRGVSNESDRVRISMDLMGRSGVELLSVMNEGSEGIKNMRAEARKLGLSLSQEETDAMAGFNDAVLRLKSALAGLITDILVPILPLIISFIDALREGGDTVVFISSAIGTMLGLGLVAWLTTSTAAVWSFTTALLANPLGAVAVAISLVVAGLVTLSRKFGKAKIATEQHNDVLENTKKLYSEVGNSLTQLEHARVRDNLSILQNTKTQIENDLKRVASAVETAKKIFAVYGDVDKRRFPGLEAKEKELQKQLEEINKQIAKGQELLSKPTEETRKSGAVIKTMNDLQNEAKKIFEQTRTPLENYNTEMKNLNDLLKQGLIDQETFNRAMDQSKERFDSLEEKAVSVFDVIKEKSREASENLIDRFSDSVFGVGESVKSMKEIFSDFFKELQAEILKVTLKKAVFGDDGKGGLLGGLLGGDGGGLSGGGAPVPVLKPQGGTDQASQMATKFADAAGPKLGTTFVDNSKGFLDSFSNILGTGSGGGFLGSLGSVFQGATSSFSGIFGSLSSSLSGILGGMGGLGGGMGGGGIGSLISTGLSLFGGFFAKGGTVRPGRAHIVGDGGEPELFVPNTVGRVVPFGQMAAAGMGGGNVSINMNVQTPDANSFRKSQGQIAGDMARQIKKAQRNL